MPPALGVFARGILLGLGAAVPIGPVNVQIARQALRRGFLAGFALGCGAVTVDVFYAILTSIGMTRLTQVPAFEWALRVGGMTLLAYLGVMCFRSEREAWHADPVTTGDAPATHAHGRRGAGSRARGDYVTGLLMTLLNPMTLAFWFVAVPAIVGAAATDAARDNVRRDLPLVCAGVFAGTISWVVCFAGVLSIAGRFRRNWWLAAADAAGGAALLVFAAAALLSSIRSLL
jgi:threonine/homoserine/homoserine lactone efflux protein